jgi:hypothetical protein
MYSFRYLLERLLYDMITLRLSLSCVVRRGEGGAEVQPLINKRCVCVSVAEEMLK